MRRVFTVIGILAFFCFILYQAYLNFFVYTEDNLTRHDQGILDSAEAGEVHSQFLIGRFLLNGRQGLARDPEAARRWFEAAAARGYAPAEFQLGEIYRRGIGVARDLTKAVGLFELASERGDLAARNAVGELHLNGDGVKENQDRAIALFRSAAEAGFAPAQRNMGYMAVEGKGMPRDYRKAMEWYRKAADQSDAIAMSCIGLMHEQGQGIEADPLRAWDCYYRAILWGHRGASQHLNRVEPSLPAKWHAQGLYERDGRDCLTGEPKRIMRPISRVRE